MTLDLLTGSLDELVVLDAGRTGRHAGHASETRVDVIGERVVDRGPVFETESHQVDAAARRVRLLSPQGIGGAGGETETAMHAIRDLIVGGWMVRVESHGRMRIGQRGVGTM